MARPRKQPTPDVLGDLVASTERRIEAAKAAREQMRRDRQRLAMRSKSTARDIQRMERALAELRKR